MEHTLREIAEQLWEGVDIFPLDADREAQVISAIERAMRLAIEATLKGVELERIRDGEGAGTWDKSLISDEAIAARMAKLLKAEAKK